jgi:hypothetical protein
MLAADGERAAKDVWGPCREIVLTPYAAEKGLSLSIDATDLRTGMSSIGTGGRSESRMPVRVTGARPGSLAPRGVFDGGYGGGLPGVFDGAVQGRVVAAMPRAMRRYGTAAIPTKEDPSTV